MRKIRKKSVVPVYGLAAVWGVYCLFFPLYKPWHFVLLIVLGAAAYAGLSALFPGKTELVEEPETTGNEEVDKLLEDGKKAVSEMERLRGTIKNPQVRAKIGDIMDVTGKIFKTLKDDPDDLPQVRRFAAYYLPTTLKLLNTYDRLGSVGSDGANISSTLTRIEDILDKTLEGYKKQLDALYANEALDIKTDITVLEGMLKREGLAGKDF